MGNVLYYGDNLDVLRRHVADESVDLVYLDPPFNSNATYNVLFREHDETPAAAQIEAFEDTWRWDTSAAAAYEEVVEGGTQVADAMLAFKMLLGTSDMLAYLSMMAPRLKELHRVLKPTGSLYLHCDPTASHYLKLLLDSIFGPRGFRSEIVWKRTSAHSDTKQGRRQHGRIHDVLLRRRPLHGDPCSARGDGQGVVDVATHADAAVRLDCGGDIPAEVALAQRRTRLD